MNARQRAMVMGLSGPVQGRAALAIQCVRVRACREQLRHALLIFSKMQRDLMKMVIRIGVRTGIQQHSDGRWVILNDRMMQEGLFVVGGIGIAMINIKPRQLLGIYQFLSEIWAVKSVMTTATWCDAVPELVISVL